MTTAPALPGGPPPPPPWHSDVTAMLWWHRPAGGTRRALPPALRRGAAVALVLGGIVDYRRGPVGPYREVFAAAVLLRAGMPWAYVAFMAVDSAASVAGGRANWALPKVLARFEDAGRGRTVTGADAWSLAVAHAVRPRAVPAWGAAVCAQVWPDGVARTFAVRMAGRAQAASVTVEVSGAAGGPGPWLRGGRHAAVLLTGRQVVSGPSPPDGRQSPSA